MTNLNVSVHDLCRVAGVPFTRRQARKFGRGFGMAHQVRQLRLIELKNETRDRQYALEQAKETLRMCIQTRNIDTEGPKHGHNIVRKQISAVRYARGMAEQANARYEAAKLCLPKYSPHIGAK